MGDSSSIGAAQGAPFTPTSWRKENPEARLEYLTQHLSAATKPNQERSAEPFSALHEALQTARACIPHLRAREVATPHGELSTSYQPYEEVVLHGSGVDAIARAVIPLVAGCMVRIIGVQVNVPEGLRGLVSVCKTGWVDDGMTEGHPEGGIVRIGGERVGLLVDETADATSFKDSLGGASGCEGSSSIYVHARISQALMPFRQSLNGAGNGEGDVAEESMRGLSITKITGLDDAVAAVNKLQYDMVCVYGKADAMDDVLHGLTARKIAVNTSPIRAALTTEGPESVLRYVYPRSVLRPFKSLLALMKHYITGRFHNGAQIAREKSAGGQQTAYALHINDVIDEKTADGPQEGVFHILEETYKYAPGERNPRIAPLLLRFEEIDGGVALSSMRLPEGVDKVALRNDNPCLWFAGGDLVPSPSFPERQIYRFDEVRMEFSIDVEAEISEMVRFRLSETLGRDRLIVSKKLWVGGKLKEGPYEQPFEYDRVYSHS